MEYLKRFSWFVTEINMENGRNYKMSVLQRYKDNEIVKYFLNYVYNPYIVTGISEKKLNRQVAVDYTTEFTSCKQILEYAKEHNTGSDKDLSIIFTNRDTLLENSNMKDEEVRICYELFNKIITKNLQLGIDVLSINKAIPNLIPTFNVQLANKYFDNPEVVEGKEFALTTKIDGGRIIAIKENGQVSFFTRAGQKYEGLVDLEQELLNCPEDNIVFDGEITLLNPYVIEKDEQDRPAIGHKLTSKEQYKETMKITRKDGEKHGVKMLVFDYMPVSYFVNQNCPLPYKARRGVLEVIFKSNTFKYFDLLPVLYQGIDTNEITKWLNYNISQGEEGVMINMVDDYYQFKRSNSLLKVKKMQDIDLPILDFEEGTNQYQNSLGALITEYKGFKLKVGSGISKELRKEIWEHKEDYRGLTMSVQYFEETTNQNGGISLRFPILLDIRTDK